MGPFHLLLKLWEKVGYIGSLEWMLATIAFYLIPGKKMIAPRDSKIGEESEVKKVPWWERGKLDVENAFYKAEWLNFREHSEINHENLCSSSFCVRNYQKLRRKGRR